jgi:hypothetical protein
MHASTTTHTRWVPPLLGLTTQHPTNPIMFSPFNCCSNPATSYTAPHCSGVHLAPAPLTCLLAAAPLHLGRRTAWDCCRCRLLLLGWLRCGCLQRPLAGLLLLLLLPLL